MEPLEPSEVGSALAKVAAELPENAARELLAVLRGDLAETAPEATRRIGNLGLLAQMVDANGEIIAPDDYDRLRTARQHAGETWPDRTTLARQWGGWTATNAAALRFWLAGRVSVDRAHARAGGASRRWAQDEVITAIHDYYRRWRQWPYAHQFYEWAALMRRLAPLHGKPIPRLPSYSAIARLWPEERFQGALAEAQRRWDNSGRGDR